MANIIFYPRRQKTGALVPRKAESSDSKISPKEAFRLRYKGFGFPDWLIEDAWRDIESKRKKTKEEVIAENVGEESNSSSRVEG